MVVLNQCEASTSFCCSKDGEASSHIVLIPILIAFSVGKFASNRRDSLFTKIIANDHIILHRITPLRRAARHGGATRLYRRCFHCCWKCSILSRDSSRGCGWRRDGWLGQRWMGVAFQGFVYGDVSKRSDAGADEGGWQKSPPTFR